MSQPDGAPLPPEVAPQDGAPAPAAEAEAVSPAAYQAMMDQLAKQGGAGFPFAMPGLPGVSGSLQEPQERP